MYIHTYTYLIPIRNSIEENLMRRHPGTPWSAYLFHTGTHTSYAHLLSSTIPTDLSQPKVLEIPIIIMISVSILHRKEQFTFAIMLTVSTTTSRKIYEPIISLFCHVMCGIVPLHKLSL